MNAWGDTGETKSFGLIGYIKFTWPRIWTGGAWRKFMVIFNFLVMVSLKVSAIFIPLLLKEVIDAITCDENKLMQQEFDKDETDKFLLR